MAGGLRALIPGEAAGASSRPGGARGPESRLWLRLTPATLPRFPDEARPSRGLDPGWFAGARGGAGASDPGHPRMRAPAPLVARTQPLSGPLWGSGTYPGSFGFGATMGQPGASGTPRGLGRRAVLIWRRLRGAGPSEPTERGRRELAHRLWTRTHLSPACRGPPPGMPAQRDRLDTRPGRVSQPELPQCTHLSPPYRAGTLVGVLNQPRPRSGKWERNSSPSAAGGVGKMKGCNQSPNHHISIS